MNESLTIQCEILLSYAEWQEFLKITNNELLFHIPIPCIKIYDQDGKRNKIGESFAHASPNDTIVITKIIADRGFNGSSDLTLLKNKMFNLVENLIKGSQAMKNIANTIIDKINTKDFKLILTNFNAKVGEAYTTELPIE